MYEPTNRRKRSEGYSQKAQDKWDSPCHPQAKDVFKEFVDTLVVALRLIEKAESPIRHIYLIRVELVSIRCGNITPNGVSI